jgi:cysteine-rich repeat protein
MRAAATAILDAGEACDDYNAFSGDGCSSTCTTEVCGDGVLNPQEDCDDGNNDPATVVRADWRSAAATRYATSEDCDPPYSIGASGSARKTATSPCAATAS